MEGSLADAARTRRERLAAMRAAAGGAPEPKRSRMAPPSETAPAVEAQEQEVTLKFRNYQPTDDAIKDVAETVVADGVSLQAVVEEKIKEQEAAGEADIHQLDSSDLLNLVPQKVDWDLKRDAAGKLEKLERRTQRAIAELVRERLEQEGNPDGLAV